jgi:LPPG:FO 2-phospho-L-lactate transferase
MRELGVHPSAAEVARRYADLLDGFIMDEVDAKDAGQVPCRVTLAQTLMTSLGDREALAGVTLAAIAAIRRDGTARRSVA